MRFDNNKSTILCAALVVLWTAGVLCGLSGCHSGPAGNDLSTLPDQSGVDLKSPADAAIGTVLCDLPGSIQTTAMGTYTVPGGQTSPDLSYLHVPPGFCVHYYGHVGNARQLRFAPGGELFVASPTQGTTGGGLGGLAAVVLLPDDNGDGYADTTITFLQNLPATQGLLFTATDFYYQDGTKIMRLPYRAGDRVASGTPVTFADITLYQSSVHWPKTLDVADDGTIYVGNGGDQDETCVVPHPFRGGVLKIDGVTLGGIPVAQGMRNPITLRCARGHDKCFALELAKDYSADQGGREKLITIHQGDDWGYPCCATKNTPYAGITPTDCSQVAADVDSFLIGNTPFGIDFESGKWPSPWGGRAFVALHGAFGTWTGARVVGIPMDPMLGLPMAASDTGNSDIGMTDFATGWDDNTNAHGRPASVTFASDGRLFLANDVSGDIVWIAPLGL